LKMVQDAFDYLEAQRDQLRIEQQEWLDLNDALDILFDAEEELGAFEVIE